MEQPKIGIVELVGVPGSGKSTLARALEDRAGFVSARTLKERICSQRWFGRQIQRFLPEPLRRKVVEVLFQPQMMAAIKELSSRRPELHRTVLDAVEASPGHSSRFREQMLFWTLRSYAMQEMAQAILPPQAYFIHDEGTVHRLATLFAGELSWQNRLWEVHRYLQHIPPMKTLFIVDAPNQVCIKRMRARRAGLPVRFAGATDQEIDHFLDTCRELSLFAGEILTRQGVQVVLIDTDKKSADELQVEMKDLLLSTVI